MNSGSEKAESAKCDSPTKSQQDSKDQEEVPVEAAEASKLVGK
jgi:hypothetical protein